MSEERDGRRMEQNRCHNCGRLLLPNDNFCPKCGMPRGMRRLSPAESARELRNVLYGPPSVMQRRLFGRKKK